MRGCEHCMFHGMFVYKSGLRRVQGIINPVTPKKISRVFFTFRFSLSHHVDDTKNVSSLGSTL